MDIQLKHEDYKYLEILEDNTVEECVECELNLPEYMPEILRIIKSTANIKVNSCRLLGERITLDGICEMRMIYTAEDNCIYSYSQSRAFTRHCENQGFQEVCDCKGIVKVTYINCRATGTKTAEIKAGLNINFKAYKFCKEDIISVDDLCSIQEKSEKLNVLGLGCRSTRGFSLSDTVPLDIPSAFVISSCCNCVITETRKINNKIMIKGDGIVDICYVNYNDKTQTEHLKHNIPINQILEFDGMDEKFTGSVSLDVTALDVICKGDANGFSNAFDISVGVNASVTMWEEQEIELITDAYSVDSQISVKNSQYKFYKALDEIREIYNYDSSFKVGGEGVQSVVDAVGEISNCKVSVENSELLLSGALSISLIIKDTKGALSSISKVLDFCYKRKADYDVKGVCARPHIKLISLECGAVNENEITVKTEMNITCSVFKEIIAEGVSSIEEGQENSCKNKNAVTVYFPEKDNESLWSIARRYSTTVEAISKENCLEGDTTEKLKIIFIPSA